jgi:hypothetical protein
MFDDNGYWRDRKKTHRVIVWISVLALVAIFAGIAYVLFHTPAAHAAEVLVPSATEDDLGGWLPLIHTIVREIIVPVLTAWMLWLAHRFVHVHNEAGLRDAIGKAVNNAANLAVAAADDQIGGTAADVGSAAMERALVYIKKNAPDAVAHWKITDANLAEKVTAELVKIGRGAAVAAISTPGPVVVAGEDPGPGQLSKR